MPQAIPMKRWQHFITSLRLDQRVDFEEGDVGLPGGAEGAVHWERFRDQFGAQRFVHNFCFNFASKRRSENLWPLEVATRFGLPRTIGSYGDVYHLRDPKCSGFGVIPLLTYVRG